MKYDYLCPTDGLVQSEIPQDMIQCRCGSQARRIRDFAFSRTALKDQARWDPVVGAYVRNDREFRNLLAQGQAREAAELGRDVVLETVDARDTEGLAELHGHSVDHRLEVKEGAERVRHDTKVTANQEFKPKALIL